MFNLQVEGVGGIFELKLNSFSNPFGLDDSAVCCNTTSLSNTRSSSSSVNSGADKSGVFSNNNGGSDHQQQQCVCSKIKFRICVKHYQVSVDPEPPCYIGETYTNESYDGNLIQLGTIFTYDFKFRWPVS